MSANLDLVRSIYSSRKGGGDYSSADWADPAIEFVIGDGPSPGRWTGLAGLAEGWRSFLSAWDEFRGEPEQFLELDDERVAVLLRVSGRGKTSGLEVAQTGAKVLGLYHVVAGKVTKAIFYFDGERALGDLGIAREAGSSRS